MSNKNADRIKQGNAGGPRAVSRVLDLLQLLSHEPDGLSLAELSQKLGVAKSTFLDTLRALAAGGFLIHDGGRYRLGPASYRLAGAIMASWSTPEIVRYYVRDLGTQTRESVGFAIADWEIGQAIYTEAVNSTQPVHYAMRAGIRAPLYASASGRVLLAYAPAERRENYLRNVRMKAFTSSTRTSLESITAHLQEIRETGYCASFGEMLEDTAAIAVPVFDPSDRNIGALMVAAPLDRMKSKFSTLLACVQAAGEAASGRQRTIEPHIGAIGG